MLHFSFLFSLKVFVNKADKLPYLGCGRIDKQSLQSDVITRAYHGTNTVLSHVIMAIYLGIIHLLGLNYVCIYINIFSYNYTDTYFVYALYIRVDMRYATDLSVTKVYV